MDLSDFDPSNTWSLALTLVSLSNNISIGSAVFCRAHPCAQQTHRQTDHATYDIYTGDAA